MASIAQFNAVHSVVTTMHDSYVDLIQKVCTTLGQSDKIEAMVEMYVDKSHAVKRKKDASAPKQARNAYQFFCDEVRPRIQKENPDLKMPQQSTLMGVEWKKLEAEAKEAYQQKADADKLRYADEMNAYDQRIFQLESSAYVGSGSQNASQPSDASTVVDEAAVVASSSS